MRKNSHGVWLKDNFITMQGTTRRFSKGLDEASTARSGLRSTEKILASQRTASMQLRLDDELQLLVCFVQLDCRLWLVLYKHLCCIVYLQACICNNLC